MQPSVRQIAWVERLLHIIQVSLGQGGAVAPHSLPGNISSEQLYTDTQVQKQLENDNTQ